LDQTEQRIELTRPKLLVPPPPADAKGRIRYNMPYVHEVRSQLENIWKDAFKAALVALDSTAVPNKDAAVAHPKSQGYFHRLKNFFAAKSRLKDYLIAGSVVACVFYGFNTMN